MKNQKQQRLIIGLWDLYVDSDGSTHLDFNDVNPPKVTSWAQVEATYTIPNEILENARTKFHLAKGRSFIDALALRGERKQLLVINFLAASSPKPHFWMATDWSQK